MPPLLPVTAEVSMLKAPGIRVGSAERQGARSFLPDPAARGSANGDRIGESDVIAVGVQGGGDAIGNGDLAAGADVLGVAGGPAERGIAVETGERPGPARIAERIVGEDQRAGFEEVPALAVGRREFERSRTGLDQAAPSLTGDVIDPPGHQQVGGGRAIGDLEAAQLAEVDLCRDGGSRVAGGDHLLAEVREMDIPEGGVRGAGGREGGSVVEGEVPVHGERGIVGRGGHGGAGVQAQRAEGGTGSHHQRSAGNGGVAGVAKGAVEGQLTRTRFGETGAGDVRSDGDRVRVGDDAGFQRQTAAGDRVTRCVEGQIADGDRSCNRDGTGSGGTEHRVVCHSVGPSGTAPVEVAGIPCAGGCAVVPGQVAAGRQRVLNNLNGIDLRAETTGNLRTEGDRRSIRGPGGGDHEVSAVLVSVLDCTGRTRVGPHGGDRDLTGSDSAAAVRENQLRGVFPADGEAGDIDLSGTRTPRAIVEDGGGRIDGIVGVL
jgi:hypothetical protein